MKCKANEKFREQIKPDCNEISRKLCVNWIKVNGNVVENWTKVTQNYWVKHFEKSFIKTHVTTTTSIYHDEKKKKNTHTSCKFAYIWNEQRNKQKNQLISTEIIVSAACINSIVHFNVYMVIIMHKIFSL